MERLARGLWAPDQACVQAGFMAQAPGSGKDDKVRTMTTGWLPGALGAFVLLATLGGLSAPALANCDWYVKTALEQQQRNLKLKCGYSGAEWSVDKGAHAAWCASVSPDASRTTAQKREADLAKCAAK
jgi:hypothetical protein